MDLSPYRNAWAKGLDFSGRATRTEFWQFTLINNLLVVIAFAGAMAAAGVAESSGNDMPIGFVVGLGLICIFALVNVIPNLAVTSRRLHDTGRSGWLMLIGMIPVINYIGAFVLLYYYCCDSEGDNQYGPAPGMASHNPMLGYGDHR